MSNTIIETLWRIATDITELRQRIVDNDHATRAAEKVSTEARRVADATNDEVRRLRERIEALESQTTTTHQAPSEVADTAAAPAGTPLPPWLNTARLARVLADRFDDPFIILANRIAREFMAMMPSGGVHPKWCVCPSCLEAAQRGTP